MKNKNPIDFCYVLTLNENNVKSAKLKKVITFANKTLELMNEPLINENNFGVEEITPNSNLYRLFYHKNFGGIKNINPKTLKTSKITKEATYIATLYYNYLEHLEEE